MSDDVLVVLESMLPQIGVALEGRRLGASIERAAERLSTARRQTERLEAFVLAAASLKLRVDRDSAAILQDALHKARRTAHVMAIAQSTSQLEELADLFREFTTALNALDTAVRMRWRRVIETEFLPFVALASVLSRIPNLGHLAGSLAEFGREAQDALERRAPPETIVAEIDRLRATRDRLDAELQSSTGNPEIDGFLKAVTANAATLAIVSPVVLAWLKEHDALATFSVAAGRT